ncbi:MAG: hypothetical protein COA62_15570 [Rhodobiaceae bacterium]|nr:MAG: hypothetical protein COA62_15570 [Rhodobiaceae bacterium]
MTIPTDVIKSKIESVKYHQFDGTQTIVCAIILKTGFVSTGESSCLSPDDFTEVVGQEVAYNKAFDKLFEHEAYRQLNPYRVKRASRAQRVIALPKH